MTKTLMACGLTALLAGCAATAANWNRPGTSMAQTEADIKRCDYEAEKATPQSHGDAIATGITDGLRVVRLRDQCMEVAGYKRG